MNKHACLMQQKSLGVRKIDMGYPSPCSVEVLLSVLEDLRSLMLPTQGRVRGCSCLLVEAEMLKAGGVWSISENSRFLT